MKNRIKLYDNKAWGFTVSEYGLQNGYLDYLTLARLVGHRILNNTITSDLYIEDWELVNGEDYNVEEEAFYDVYQFYMISEAGYRVLSELTDEIVYYNDRLDIYVWGITHFGTSWDYVLTDVKLVTEGTE